MTKCKPDEKSWGFQQRRTADYPPIARCGVMKQLRVYRSTGETLPQKVLNLAWRTAGLDDDVLLADL
jgi:hypothetical protein